MDRSKLATGLSKIVLGIALALGSMFLVVKGCQDVRESLHDESGTSITDETGNEIEI